MMDLKITDKNDNVIYRSVDKYSDMADELSYNDIKQCLEDSSSDMFNLEYSCDSENFHYSVLKHTDKESILKELPSLIEDYNSHVAALPACHPAEHSTALERESVSESSEDNVDFDDFFGRLEPWYRSADGLGDETVERLWDLYRRYPGRDYWMRPYSWMRKVDCDGWCDIVKPKHNDNGDSLFGHFECRGYGGGCVGPGTFVFSDKFSSPCDDSCERDSCEGASDDVEPVEEWELTETQKHEISVLKDFIGYLRTQPTWAALIGKLNYYNDPDDEIGKQKLIDDFCEYMRNRESQAKTGADAERR